MRKRRFVALLLIVLLVVSTCAQLAFAEAPNEAGGAVILEEEQDEQAVTKAPLPEPVEEKIVTPVADQKNQPSQAQAVEFAGGRVTADSSGSDELMLPMGDDPTPETCVAPAYCDEHCGCESTGAQDCICSASCRCRTVTPATNRNGVQAEPACAARKAQKIVFARIPVYAICRSSIQTHKLPLILQTFLQATPLHCV